MSATAFCSRSDLFNAGEAAAYDCVSAAMPARYHRAHQVQNAALLANMHAAYEPALLEIGPGTCKDLSDLRTVFSSRSFQWTGIERSQSMIDAAMASQRIPNNAETQLILADAFEDEAWSQLHRMDFDACFSAFVLHHYSEEARLWIHRRAIERLRVGGIYIVTDLFASGDIADKSHGKEAQDVGAAVLKAKLLAHVDRERLRAAWVQHYLHENQPPVLEHEVESLYKLGCSVRVAMRSIQVAVVIATKDS